MSNSMSKGWGSWKGSFGKLYAGIGQKGYHRRDRHKKAQVSAMLKGRGRGKWGWFSI